MEEAIRFSAELQDREEVVRVYRGRQSKAKQRAAKEEAARMEAKRQVHAIKLSLDFSFRLCPINFSL